MSRPGVDGLRAETDLALGDAHNPSVIGQLNDFKRGAVEPLMQLELYE